MKQNKSKMGNKALEMVMRDVLDGLTDFAMEANYSPQNGHFSILSIESPDEAAQEPTVKPARQCRQHKRKADVISFIVERERLAS
ncbi:MAG: hypothetical protein BMS9Abin26_0511 [Gammaproteobacteria bacterium]|nr:MAG: hypothetical protein BMS9Abin26_0511 [Gammaproteobacteria bacterium]